ILNRETGDYAGLFPSSGINLKRSTEWATIAIYLLSVHDGTMRMGSLSRLLLTLALDALLGSASEGRAPSGPSNAAPRTASRPLANLSDACEPMTINYITHTLPQQCHKSRSHWAIPT